MHLRQIHTSLTTHSQGRHPREILNLTRRTKLLGTRGSNSTTSVLDQPPSKYVKLLIDEQDRVRGNDDHVFSPNVDDTTGKRKKGKDNVPVDSHLAKRKRPKQPSQIKNGGAVRRNAVIRRENIDAGHSAGEMNGRNDDSVDVPGWQRPLSAKPPSQYLPVVECNIRTKGIPPSKGSDSGRWTKCGAKRSVAGVGVHKQQGRPGQDRQKNISNKGVRAFRTLETAVKMKTNDLRDRVRRSNGSLSDGDCAEKLTASCGAHNTGGARRSSSSSETSSSMIGRRMGIKREQRNYGDDVDDWPRSSLGRPAAGSDLTRVHPLQLPGNRSSPVSRCTFSSDLSPDLEFSGQQALAMVDFNCQGQLPPPANIDAPSTRSPLPSGSLHGDDVEFVSKDFGDSLLGDCRTFEGRSFFVGDTTGLLPNATLRVACGQDTMFSSSFWKFVRDSEPRDGRGEGNTEDSPNLIGRGGASDHTTGMGARVRFSPGLPPIPTALSLQSPNHETASWGSRL